jgi:hypothetical protein
MRGQTPVRTCHLISTPLSSSPMGSTRVNWVRAPGVADAGKELSTTRPWNGGLQSGGTRYMELHHSNWVLRRYSHRFRALLRRASGTMLGEVNSRDRATSSQSGEKRAMRESIKPELVHVRSLVGSLVSTWLL